VSRELVVTNPHVTRKTIVYIDGFNLYFGCLKGTPYRWLNLWEFAQNIATAQAEVSAVRYFTARVTHASPFGFWASLCSLLGEARCRLPELQRRGREPEELHYRSVPLTTIGNFP